MGLGCNQPPRWSVSQKVFDLKRAVQKPIGGSKSTYKPIPIAPQTPAKMSTICGWAVDKADRYRGGSQLQFTFLVHVHKNFGNSRIKVIPNLFSDDFYDFIVW